MKTLMVFVAALALLASFAVPAMAGKMSDVTWDFYGAAKVQTFRIDTDKPTGSKDDADTLEYTPVTAVLGATVKASEELSGGVELGSEDYVHDRSYGNNGIEFRLLYGTWNFDPGKLSIGKMYTPLNIFISHQAFGLFGNTGALVDDDNDMLNYGGVFGGRNSAVQFQLKNFKIALVSYASPDALDSGLTDTDVDLPKIEAAYHRDIGKFFFDVQGAYFSYSIDGGTYAYDVTSYIAATAAGYDFGPVYIKGDLWVGRNVGAYTGDSGGFFVEGDADPDTNSATHGLYDNDSYGFLAVVGGKVTDRVAWEAGYGYVNHSLDRPGYQDDETSAYYAQAPITLSHGVLIVPEIGVIDCQQDQTGADQNKFTYYGIKWQINF